MKHTGRYGSRTEMLTEALQWRWEQFWLCKIRRVHREKFGSNGRCIRCNKKLR